jgi:hypothetical protein
MKILQWHVSPRGGCTTTPTAPAGCLFPLSLSPPSPILSGLTPASRHGVVSIRRGMRFVAEGMVSRTRLARNLHQVKKPSPSFVQDSLHLTKRAVHGRSTVLKTHQMPVS